MPTPRFLNVDLDLFGHTHLQPLIDHWHDQMGMLVTPEDTDKDFVRFEVLEQHSNAADTIAHFCKLVESLPPDLLLFWYQCPERSLDIGYDSGTTRPMLQESLPLELLVKMAQYFTALNISIYSVE